MAHLIPSLAHTHWIPATIFCLTYLFIAIESSRDSHLDRTAAAFCGAVAMVLAGALTLGEAYKAIDWNTLIFLLGMMILVAHFQVSGVFDWIASTSLSVARTRLQLLVILVLTSGILAAFFVNDTICLIFTPIVLAVTDRLKVPPIPYLIALATSANIGSVMSVTGNPQNALVGISAHLSFLAFLFHLAPVALIGLAINAAVLALFFRRDVLHQPLEGHAPSVDRSPRSSLARKVFCCRGLLVVALWVVVLFFLLVAIALGAFILVIGRVKSAEHLPAHRLGAAALFRRSVYRDARIRSIGRRGLSDRTFPSCP